MERILFIPACGYATRLGCIPKYLLPISSSSSLLTNIIRHGLSSTIDRIVVFVRYEHEMIVDEHLDFHFKEKEERKKIELFCLDTNTMSETIYLGTIKYAKKDDIIIVLLPDVYYRKNPIPSLLFKLTTSDTQMAVGLYEMRESQRGKLGQVKVEEDKIIDIRDKDKTCPYLWIWGALGWISSPKFQINPLTPHIGYMISTKSYIRAVILDGPYFYDCGTFDEYVSCLNFISSSTDS